MQMTGNTILITGGGSGIGRGLAEAFQKLGNTVIISGRRQSTLNEVTEANPGMSAYPLDVTDPASITGFATRIVEDHPGLNIVINNAGVMFRGELMPDTLDLAAAEATITTNLLGPMRLTAALLPHLRTRADAKIVNVSSGLAFVPLADAAAYSATKAAIHSWTVSLRHMLKDAGISVIELLPPGVQTELTPGQSTFDTCMPLDSFISEVMTLFAQDPTPDEIAVERVKPLRNAERDGQFEAALAQVNG